MNTRDIIRKLGILLKKGGYITKKQVVDDLEALDITPEKLATHKEYYIDLLCKEEYGVIPKRLEEANVNFVMDERRDFDGFFAEKIRMLVGNLSIREYLWLPSKCEKPSKTFILPLHPSAYIDKDFFTTPSLIADYCPVKEVTQRGYAVIFILLGDVADDDFGGENTGVFREFDIKRTLYSMGVLQAWAWSVRKTIEFVVRDKRLDEKNIASIGHSRGGKTSLLAGMQDTRIKLVISNNSGSSGAAISRGKKGEDIESIVRRFPYWFNLRYAYYSHKEYALPFDQHILLGLIAPRYCYVASATKDAWAGPENELLATRFASKYYEYYNVKGSVIPNKPIPNTPYASGHLAYHIRKGGHDLTAWDYARYMDLFDKI